jgi:molybdopterin/thiamine biosynthesis adenylyltransferase
VTRYTLTLREDHDERLRALVMPRDGNEGAALILCGTASILADPWDGIPTLKLVSREVVPIGDEDLVSSSPAHITCRTNTFARALKRAASEGLTVGFVHSHPRGHTGFSPKDDSEEPLLVELAQHRNGLDAKVLSVVLTPDEGAVGRIWHDMSRYSPLSMVLVVGDTVRLSFDGRFQGQTPKAFHRQALAFGQALCADLAALRVVVVGCGATGSATSLLLARLGVRRLALIDGDPADETNLSRTHGLRMKDVSAGKLKVDVLKDHIQDLGLGTQVLAFPHWVGTPECRDVLRASDIVFGCTDDNDGRLLLNRLAYFYSIPVIDMGIRIDPSDDDPPRILEAAGRVTVVAPGTRCLLCRNVIDPERAREEQIKRENPEEHARQLGEGYVRGGGPSPAVITMTTEVACMAVDELIQRLTGYRAAGSRSQRVRKYHLLEDKRPGSREQECRICVDQGYWGRGDVEPFLDRVG